MLFGKGNDSMKENNYFNESPLVLCVTRIY